MNKLILKASPLVFIFFLGYSSANVFADEVVNGQKDFQVKVTLTDEDSGTDPLDPSNSTQTHLNLISVPTSYDFESTLQHSVYQLSATLTNSDIKVFNDRSIRAWSVKAAVVDNKVSRGDVDFNVTSFKINNNELVGNSADPIVAKSADTPSTDNNTGTLTTAVSTAAIEFSDPNGVLKAGNSLTGTITYQLYNTDDAQ